jgi:hypothetical protein
VRVARIGAHLSASVCAVGAVAATWLSFAMTAVAASPTPQAAGGDPRSSGQGPGLVGDPAFALIAVLAIGLGSLLATLIYVRLTARRGS